MRSLVYETLDPRLSAAGSRAFRWVHHLAIVVGISAMVLDTVPSFEASEGGLLEIIFNAALAFWVVEYLLRLYAAPEAPWAHPEAPWRSRLQWAVSVHGVVDLLAFLPILIATVVTTESSIVRLLSIFWLLKFAPYSLGLIMLGRVVRNARDQLLSVFLTFAMILLTAGALAYVFERHSQPDTFGSIPGALWWAIVTLTTTGYGDQVPVTVGGRLLAGVVMICGIGVFALWAGILASSFSDEIRRREFLRTWDLVAKVPFFHDVGAGTIAEVTRLLKPRDVSQGTAVMRRGQPGDCMYFVVNGEVEIQIDPPVRLGAGAFFGEIALITGAPRMASAVAVQPTTLLSLDIADFRDLAARRPELDEVIRAEAARRIGANSTSP